MNNFKMRRNLPFIILLMVSCRQGKVKVVSETYAKGNPKIIYYFGNKEDATQYVSVQVKDGVGHANKPVSFDEERYYENGKLRSKGHFIKGQSCGLWQYFYETGVPQARCYYLNGVTKDTVYCWYPSGKLKRFLLEIDTVKNKWHGIDYYENGNKSIENNLLSDAHDHMTVDGKWNEWFENGKQKFQAAVENNLTVGKWEQWDSVGNLKEGEKPISINFW